MQKKFNKKIVAYCLILIKVVIEIYGSINYKTTSSFVWSLSNAILIMVPLAFGIELGFFCFLPCAVAEIVWFCKLTAIGPLLHLASFAVTFIILGLIYDKLKHTKHPRRVIVSSLIYEVSLLGEEALYYGLRMLFLNRPMQWAEVSETFLSLANPLILLVLVFCIIEKRSDASNKTGDSSES